MLKSKFSNYLYKITILVFAFVIGLSPNELFGQSHQKKQLTDRAYEDWNRITNTQISKNGLWSIYLIKPNKGDKTLVVYDNDKDHKYTFPRATNATLDHSGQFVVFKTTAAADSLVAWKRAKREEDDFPRDTLSIYDYLNKKMVKLPNLKSYKLPGKWSGYLAYQLENRETIEPKDSTEKKIKKENKKNGSRLIIRELLTGKEDTFGYVTHYQFAEEKAILVLQTTGKDDDTNALIRYDLKRNRLDTIQRGRVEFEQININRTGERIAYIADIDTTEERHRPYRLYHWDKKKRNSTCIADSASMFLQEGWQINPHHKPFFSENNDRIFFYSAPKPLLTDTSLIDEEKVQVEIWHYKDPKLHTQQERELERTRKKGYLAIYDIAKEEISQIGNLETPTVAINNNADHRYGVGINDLAYQPDLSWIGYARKDLYRIDLTNGERSKIVTGTQGNIRISPNGHFAFWYAMPDSCWYTYDLKNETLQKITHNKQVKFYNELQDHPTDPRSNGYAGWIEEDAYILINDRYDIWQIDPRAKEAPKRLTQGREKKWVYRYRSMNRDIDQIPMDTSLVLRIFDERDKSSGYASLGLSRRETKTLLKGDFYCSTRPIKAKESNTLLFSMASFTQFPDLQLSDTSFTEIRQISDVNPQQKDFAWGTAELYKWQSYDGSFLEGLLIKPEGFDPKKKYPLIVNFYERSSHRLHSHRAPYPHRSTINYSIYANKGYVIFNPDIVYRDGYPGQSCFDAVMSGMDKLIAEGYIATEKIGVQGHSWGGYQIAHLLTKTNRFACAEAGAPVVNMTSAYGGIRWRSGRSRMFQYERTQSRIGGTLWEKPALYLENSPLFQLDKVETPVLILHNDNDGAVPWYQGIEYFVGLRRLGKPAWMLNYNGEPHWPVKWQNRMDFQKRMSQFFDHYLLDKPMPSWMEKGVPAIEKGITSGY